MSADLPDGLRPAASYDRGEMIALLTVAAHADGAYSMVAAVHLLTYTALPGRADFARHVDLQVVAGAADADVLGARVRNWGALLGDDSGVDLTGSDRKMLEVAASYAAGRPVDLSEHGQGLGIAHAQRLVEAVAVGAGVGEYLNIAELRALWLMHSGGIPLEMGHTIDPGGIPLEMGHTMDPGTGAVPRPPAAE
jgi:hypothetical protein